MTTEELLIRYYGEKPIYAFGELFMIGRHRVYYFGGKIYKVGDDFIEYINDKVVKVGNNKVNYSFRKRIRIGNRLFKGDKTVILSSIYATL